MKGLRCSGLMAYACVLLIFTYSPTSSAAVRVIQVQPNTIELLPGRAATVRITGTDLYLARSVEVYSGTQRISAIRGAVQASATQGQITFTLVSSVPPGTFSVRLGDGRRSIASVPMRLVVGTSGTGTTSTTRIAPTTTQLSTQTLQKSVSPETTQVAPTTSTVPTTTTQLSTQTLQKSISPETTQVAPTTSTAPTTTTPLSTQTLQKSISPETTQLAPRISTAPTTGSLVASVTRITPLSASIVPGRQVILTLEGNNLNALSAVRIRQSGRDVAGFRATLEPASRATQLRRRLTVQSATTVAQGNYQLAIFAGQQLVGVPRGATLSVAAATSPDPAILAPPPTVQLSETGQQVAADVPRAMPVVSISRIEPAKIPVERGKTVTVTLYGQNLNQLTQAGLRRGGYIPADLQPASAVTQTIRKVSVTTKPYTLYGDYDWEFMAGQQPVKAPEVAHVSVVRSTKGYRAFSRIFDLTPDPMQPNWVNVYLTNYLATLVYANHLGIMASHDPGVGGEDYGQTLDQRPLEFLHRFVEYTSHLFDQPDYAWIYAPQDRLATRGYDPEAMVISTPDAVFVVFRGTDQVASAMSLPGYYGLEWIYSDFYATQKDTDASRKDTDEQPADEMPGKVHAGFYDSLKVSGMEVARYPHAANAASNSDCLEKNEHDHDEDSFRECLWREIRAAIRKPDGGRKPIWMAGHSLGAAQVQVFAGYARTHRNKNGNSDGIFIDGVHAYAAPHPGDPVFADALERQLGLGRLKRFDFIDDPVTMVPPIRFGPYRYGRAGTRIYYDSIDSAEFNAPERPFMQSDVDLAITLAVPTRLISLGYVVSNICYHGAPWYLRSAYNTVMRHNPNENRRLNLPDPLSDQEGTSILCRPVHLARARQPDSPEAVAVSTAKGRVKKMVYDIQQLLNNATGDAIEEGRYYIRSLEHNKYLNAPNPKNGDAVQLWDLSKENPYHKFKITKAVGVPGYLVERDNKYLEIDGNELMNESIRVQMWEANLPFGQHAPNQFWLFFEVQNMPDHYVLLNSATPMKVLDGQEGCKGCKVMQTSADGNNPSHVWLLEKIN
jgi:hypothetical protein